VYGAGAKRAIFPGIGEDRWFGLHPALRASDTECVESRMPRRRRTNAAATPESAMNHQELVASAPVTRQPQPDEVSVTGSPLGARHPPEAAPAMPPIPPMPPVPPTETPPASVPEMA
jgi:hypothetical protein